MIKFVDLKTGNTFNGEQPYIFWFDEEQSINIIYSKPICFISDQPDVIDVRIENNKVFNLIDPSKLINSHVESIYGFEYQDINEAKVFSIKSEGTPHHNYFIHIIYITASADHAGEYIGEFYINDTPYKVGADFYDANEELYINLSNNGVEIPDAIQKALYNVNIHEEHRDNITLNRKWKELLSNFWDVITNKGSYKNLYNSLSWFEYGDKVRLCEVWKNIDSNNYFVQDIQEILKESFFETLNGFAKTSYLALYYALEKPVGSMILDDEKNPELELVASKWSVQDLALKLCLLGNFYKTYFLPIHLDLIHSTIEDVVYTNTFKNISGTTVNRSDYIYSFEDISCNIKDGDIFRLNLVDCCVGPNTLFGATYEEFEKDKIMVGVQREPVGQLRESDWSQYASQLYHEIGAIVDFKISILLNKGDKIKRELIIFTTFNTTDQKWIHKSIENFKILDKDINFSLFCPSEGEYTVRLLFESLDGQIYTKIIKFNVIDTNSVTLNVYKIQNMQLLDDQNLDQKSQINNYMISRRRLSDEFNNFTQYIPVSRENLYENKFNWKGICLNHLLIIKGDVSKYILQEDSLNIFKRYYFIKYKHTENTTYSVCVSNIFGFNPNDNEYIKKIYNELKNIHHKIYREDYIFVPEFHTIVPLDNERCGRKEELRYYTITDDDALCVIPDIPYGKYIAEYDWEFVNVSRPLEEPVRLKYIKEPFISNIDQTPMKPGYYNIRFNYRLTNENKINTIELNSAFKKI